MPIKFRCEHCRQLLGISKSKAGQVVDCPTCGRSVSVPSLDGKSSPVPVPKLNLNDDALVNALDALAGIGGTPSPPLALDESASAVDGGPPHQTEPPQTEAPQEGGPIVLPPAPAPEPVELPPLEKPVAIVEPAPVTSAPTPDGPVEPVAIPELRTKEETRDADRASAETSRKDQGDPLRVLAAAAPPPRAAPEVKSAGNGTGSPLMFALVAGLAFATGFLVHAQFYSSPSGTDAPVASDTEKEKTPPAPKPVDGRPSPNDVAVRGRITFRTTDGSSQPDSGACVIFLPAQRSGSAKLTITGFRPADSDDDRQIARTTIRAIGGELAVVNESGNFTAQLKRSGTYHVVVLSHFQERPTGDETLTASVRTLLGSYFERPDQLPGKRRFALGQVRYRGEGTEEWDYSFERS